MSFLYRPHRGLLADAMKEVVKLKDKNELIWHIQREWHQTTFEISDKTIQTEEYGYDDRINWNTWIITLEMNGKPAAIGYTNGPINK